MIAPDHPAVEAAIRGWFGTATGTDRGDMNVALVAAQSHLTTATPENLARLRDTPVGRALMAEAWKAGEAAGSAFRRSTADTFPTNPYLEADQ